MARAGHRRVGAEMTIRVSEPAKSAMDGLYAKLTWAALIFFVVVEAVYLVRSGLPSYRDPSLDFTGNAIGRDFITTWMGGRSVHGYGAALHKWFDPEVYNVALRVMLGPNFPEHFWSYPPHLVLFTWPLGLLPYLPAYVLWCVVGLALYLLACSAVMRREHMLFLAAAPGVAVCIFFGENGFYTAALLIGGFALLDRRPILAGILFGILTVKPQLGILLPIMLLLQGRWWAILAAIVTVFTLAIAAAYTVSPEVWRIEVWPAFIEGRDVWPAIIKGLKVWWDFIEKVIPQQRWLLENGGGLFFLMVSSVFFAGRLIGLPIDLAWNLQGLVSFLAVAAVIWTYWRRRDAVLSMALFVTATFLASPYVFNYDMVIFGFIVAALLQRGNNTAVDHALGIAIWSLPVTMMLFGAISIPIAPLVLAAFGGRLLWRLSKEGQVSHQTLETAPQENPASAPIVEETPTPASIPA